MLAKTLTVLLLLVGLVNLLPVTGIISAGRLASLYALDVSEPNLLVLMRHRALLFGILGLFICAAAFVPAWQLPAMLMAGVSMFGFILLAWQAGSVNAALGRVVIVDIVALALLAAAAMCWWLGRSGA